MQFGADCLAVRRGVRLQHRRRHRLRRAHPAAAVPLPRRVPRERAAQARLARTCSRSRSSGALEGPLPLRVAGKASFEILWCDFSVRVRHDPRRRRSRRTTSCRSTCSPCWWTQLSPTPAHWQAQLAGRRRARWSACASPVRPTACSLHPLGTLTVRQNVVPLEPDPRHRPGRAPRHPAATARFTITQAALGDQGHDRGDSVRELFAPGQFFDLSDDDELAAPSFESMDAGVTFGADGYTIGYAAGLVAVRLHRHHHRRRRQRRSLEPEPHTTDGAACSTCSCSAPASRGTGAAHARRSGFAGTGPRRRAPAARRGLGGRRARHGPASDGDARCTWVEAARRAARHGRRRWCPAAELVG